MKKHLNKILVFSLNLLLMAVAILVMKEKDQVRLSEKKQNDLLNNNASLSNENAALKNELQSLQGVAEEIKSAVTGEEQTADIPKAEAKTPEMPVSANASTPAKSPAKKPSKSNPANSATSNQTASPAPAPASTPAASSPNSQTKTS